MNPLLRLRSHLKDLFAPRKAKGKSNLGAQSVEEREEWRDALAFTILRVISGGIVIPHGVSQLMGGGESIAAATLAQLGIEPSTQMVYLIIFLELVGGICVTVGFFTRAFAGALAVEMFWAASMFWFDRPDQSAGRDYAYWEFPLILGIIMFALALGGGGRWSLDRLFGDS